MDAWCAVIPVTSFPASWEIADIGSFSGVTDNYPLSNMTGGNDNCVLRPRRRFSPGSDHIVFNEQFGFLDTQVDHLVTLQLKLAEAVV